MRSAIKTGLLATVFAFGTLATATAAPVAPEGWYVGGGAGLNILQDLEEPIDTFPLTGFNSDFDNGWAGVGAVGYNFGTWRLELEGSYRSNDLDGFRLAGVPQALPNGENTTWAAMVNAVWDLPVADKFVLSLGGGLGYASTSLDVRSGAVARFDATEGYLAYQGIAGLAFAVAPKTHLFVDYRYFAGNADFTTRVAPIAGSEQELGHHTILAGLRYYFGTPAAAPVEEKVEPKPVEAVREFVVFFDFDKANLTSDARTVVAEAAAAAKAGSNVKITVTGHTDTVGSQAYNQRLSERRANAVKAELVRQGLGDGDITTVGKSFNEPAVNTGPGVKEPRNRRAVIDLQ